MNEEQEQLELECAHASTNKHVEYTGSEWILSVFASKSSINMFPTMCSGPGLLYVWQHAVRMINEDLCARLKTASWRQPYFSEANGWEQTFSWNAAQLLRKEGEYRCIATKNLSSFHKGCLYTWTVLTVMW